MEKIIAKFDFKIHEIDGDPYCEINSIGMYNKSFVALAKIFYEEILKINNEENDAGSRGRR